MNWLRRFFSQRGSMSFRGKDIRETIREINNTFGGDADRIHDDDDDTEVHTEKNLDEDKVRIKTGGAERAVIDSTSFGLKKDYALALDQDEGNNSYFIYNSVNDYIEMYVDGGLRAQF